MYSLFAASLNPGGLLAWIVVGLVAGFLQNALIRGGGYSIIGDVIAGVVGAFIGGLLVNLLTPDENYAYTASVVVAFISAVILIFILRAISRTRR